MAWEGIYESKSPGPTSNTQSQLLGSAAQEPAVPRESEQGSKNQAGGYKEQRQGLSLLPGLSSRQSQPQLGPGPFLAFADFLRLLSATARHHFLPRVPVRILILLSTVAGLSLWVALRAGWVGCVGGKAWGLCPCPSIPGAGQNSLRGPGHSQTTQCRQRW